MGVPWEYGWHPRVTASSAPAPQYCCTATGVVGGIDASDNPPRTFHPVKSLVLWKARFLERAFAHLLRHDGKA